MQASPVKTRITDQTQQTQHQQPSTQPSPALHGAFSLPEGRDIPISPFSLPTSSRTTPKPSAEQSRSPMSTPGRERCNNALNSNSTQTQTLIFSPSAPHFSSRLGDASHNDIAPVVNLKVSTNDTAFHSPNTNSITTREREHAHEREAELETSKEVLRTQGSPTPTQESVVPLRTHALSPSADPFSPPNLHSAVYTTSSRHPSFTSNYDQPNQCQTSNMQSTTTLTMPMGNTSSSPTPSELQIQDGKTPNVYINGLPPNFQEEQLLKMTKEFGTVISVRTFTRHVSDKPSGYGFVLFETVEAAEKCIETLRKYRNLHPSFSKQLHKIPGTPYASISTAHLDSGPPPDSFKARMEILHDKTSTNLYMEGLPMTTDEKMLAALVKPHRIMSNRFFQTRLSSPPRIIAFVRLETRAAAEEIIERLHGRPLRGLDETGSRISVRFADTSEQREMRRMERLSREDEHSPSRLTMAQAALLNLKGTQIQGSSPQNILPGHSLGARASISPLSSSLHSPESIYGRSGLPLPLSITPSPYQHTTDLPLLMDTHLNGYTDLNGLGAPYVSRQNLRASPQHAYEDELAMLREMQMQQHANARSVSNRAHNGYTEMERLILQAHAQQQAHLAQAQAQIQAQSQRQLHAAQALSSNMESRRKLLNILPQLSEDDFHATAGGAHLVGSDMYHGREPSNGSSMSSPQIFGSTSDPSQLAMDMDRQLSLSQQQQHQRMQTHAALTQPRQTLDGAHTRSTTFPAKYPGARTGSQGSTYGVFGESGGLGNGYDGLSVNTIRNMNTKDSNTLTYLQSSKNNHYASNINDAPTNGVNVLGNSSNSNSNKINIDSNSSITSRHSSSNGSNSNTSNINNSKHLIRVNSSGLPDSTGIQTHHNSLFSTSKPIGAHNPVAPTLNTTHLVPADTHNGLRSSSSSHVTSPEESDGGSPLVSPALTYSARTPATLSPATPFSGFFGHSLETFDGLIVGVPGGDGGHLESHKVPRAASGAHPHKTLPGSTGSNLNVNIGTGNMNMNVSAGR